MIAKMHTCIFSCRSATNTVSRLSSNIDIVLFSGMYCNQVGSLPLHSQAISVLDAKFLLGTWNFRSQEPEFQGIFAPASEKARFLLASLADCSLANSQQLAGDFTIWCCIAEHQILLDCHVTQF